MAGDRRYTDGTIYLMRIPEQLGFADVEGRMSVLSEERQRKIKRYLGEDSKVLSFCCAFLVRRILERDFHMAQEQICVSWLKGGKPVLVDGNGSICQPQISWSHSRRAVAVAVSREPVGVDLEWIGRYRESIVRKNFSAAERERLEHSDSPEQEFYRLWTRKEAFVKRSGEGMTRYLGDIPTQGDCFESRVWEQYMVSVCGVAGPAGWTYRVEELTGLL